MSTVASGQNVGNIYYQVKLDTAAMIAEQRRVDRELTKTGDRLEMVGAQGDKLQTRLTKMATAVGAAISAIAVGTLLTKVIEAQRGLDVMMASLKTMTGSTDAAAAAFERLEKFAEQTPYSLEQAVQGYVKLRALGLDPSERAMTSFGNTASAMGKDLMQMIEAVADAATSEFERLKEFGIKAKQEGDKVKLTFQGVTTTVQNNARSITEYLVRIGEVNFGGAMSDRMKTLDGNISNLQDSIGKLYRSIGQAGVGEAVAMGVRAASEAIEQLSVSVREGGLTEYFDALKPVIAAGEVAIASLAAVMAGRLVAAMVAGAQATMVKVGASREAAAASLIELKAAQNVAFELAGQAAASRAAALATADRAAASVTAAGAEMALATVEAERTAAAAALARGTLAQATTSQAAAAASARLTAAKTVEAEATAALTVAERALAVARGQEAVAAVGATASTVALTAAQRAQALGAVLATKAATFFGTVLTALGGPIGIIIIALTALALNWEKVGGKAKDAATMSEDAADRIAAALRKSSARAGKDLAAQLAEAKDELAGIDQELARTSFPLATDEELSELRSRRATLIGIVGDIQRAMDTLHGGAGRGKVNPDSVVPTTQDDDDSKTRAKALAAKEYYEGLVAQHGNARARIDAEERKALAENERRALEDKANAGTYAKAKVEIYRKYARERAILEETNTEAMADANIATTIDEVDRIVAIREEAYRRADASVKLGQRTEAQAAAERKRAAFESMQSLADLDDRNATARAATQVASTKDAEAQITIIRNDAIRRAQDGYLRGKMTFEEAEAAKTQAIQQAIEQRRALEQGWLEYKAGTLQIRAESGNLDDQVAAVRAKAEAELAATEEARQRDLANAQIYADRRVEIEVDMHRRIADLQLAASTSQLSMMGNVFGQIYGLLQKSGKDQTALAKAAFLAERAIAVATIIMNTEVAAAKAGAQLGIYGIPIATALRAAGYVSAGLVAGMAIGEVAGGRQYGGPVTAGSLYRVNEQKRPEMYTAANGDQFMLPTANGQVTAAEKVGAGGGMVVNIHNYEGAKVRQQQSSDGQQLDIFIGEAARQIRENEGQLWSAMQAGTNVRSKLG